MPANVKLKVIRGEHPEREIDFNERTVCIVGRSSDCALRVTKDAKLKWISRHHCLLDINPPDIRIRDYGSRNGTLVNGEKIGQRSSRQPNADESFPERDIYHGDIIKLGLGEIEFLVEIFTPQYCCSCDKEVSEQAACLSHENEVQCTACFSVAQTESFQNEAPKSESSQRSQPPPLPRGPRCAQCGENVSDECPNNRKGDYVCLTCRNNPDTVVSRLLMQARQGNDDLKGIRGFVVERELGRGGMGAVYLLKHEVTNEQVALKIMLPRVAADDHATEMFQRETENTKALDHPNIVKLLSRGESDGAFFFTLEFCDVGSLIDIFKERKKPLPIDMLAPFAMQTLDGLTYAHRAKIPNVRMKDGSYRAGKGLVHRDLKPQNIFVKKTDDGLIAKIGDFGLSKAFELAGLSGQTATMRPSGGHLAYGTPVFMPRAQVRNYKRAQPDVDVWAAAATFYYLLTGYFVRDFPDKREYFQRILRLDAVPIRKRNRKIPRKLAEVIDAALKEDPNPGFKTAAEFKRALETVL